MINKYTNQQQQCYSCGHSLLESIGSQSFCANCRNLTSNLQHEIRVVPEQYQSNSRNNREIDLERKYNMLIREFSDKYRQLRTGEDVKVLRERLAAIKRMTARRKGSRQAAGVVVYCEMLEDIKMNMKQYCRHNNLSIKIFHQKYKIYKELFKNIPTMVQLPQLPLSQVKIEEKIEEDLSPTEKESQGWRAFQSDELPSEEQKYKEQNWKVEGAEHAIQLIYEDVFNKYIYKQKRSFVISGLVKKVQETSEKVLELIKYQDNKPMKLYYLIFAVIKALGHKISFMDYYQVIKNRTGFILKRKMAGEIKRIYENKPIKVVKRRKKSSKGRGREVGEVKMQEGGGQSDGEERQSLSDMQLPFY